MERDLQELMRELSAAIERTREGDEDRAELARLVAAVERRLSDEEAVEDQSRLLDMLQKAEIRFQSDHPLLGRALQQAVQALTAAGI